MVSTAILFPGQGAQFFGMGRKLIGLRRVVETLEECADASSLPIMDYVLKTPDAVLRETNRAQPAIFALSVSLARILLDEGVKPGLYAGHSIGHFSALVISGSLRLSDAAHLVAERGRLMAASGKRRPGGMGVVHTLDEQTVTEAIEKSGLPLWSANFNLLDQIVVSGERGALEKARALFTDLGGRWCSLNVSGAFHSPLLDAEAAEFAATVETIEVGTPSVPVLRNCDGMALTRAETVRKDLKRHMMAPVRWTAVMDAMRKAGITLGFEAGPGRVLTGLMMRHVPALSVMSTGTPALLQRAVQAARMGKE